MVRLTKIYTRTGDDGTTGLATGQRVRKDDPRVEAYGTVDETNAAIGLAVIQADLAHQTDPFAPCIAAILRNVKHDLFDLGADLATPVAHNEPDGSRLRIVTAQVNKLERAIDEHNERLAPLNSFVLPGGSPLAAALHLARTITRRAERLAVTLASQDIEGVNAEAVKYLNRLSDLLFVLSRVANEDGKKDVLWVPGSGRK
jgi:cob(I)alamin adenosyltransferase